MIREHPSGMTARMDFATEAIKVKTREEHTMPKRPLKIGYIWQYESADLSPVSATALHVKAVVQGFEQRGHQVRMVAIRDGKPHWSDDLENWHPIEFKAGQSRPFRLFESGIRRVQSTLDLPYFRLFNSYRFAGACAAVLDGYDILYERFWFLGYGGLMAARRLKAPLVYEVNGDLVEEYNQLGIKLSRRQWQAIHYVTRRMFSSASQVITVSEVLRKSTIRRWSLDPKKVVAVPNGAHVNLFTQPADAEAVKSLYSLKDEPVIIFVGSFKPWHGVDLLLEAFCRLADSCPAKLVLVGDGPMRAELEKRAAQLGLTERVIFTGAVPHPEVAALLETARIAVLNPRVSPASRSQSPLKLFEYMAAGKAIVAPASPNVEGVLVHRENALLVPPDNLEALTEAMAELLDQEELAKSLGEAASQQAFEKHSWDKTVAELEDIFLNELDSGEIGLLQSAKRSETLT